MQYFQISVDNLKLCKQPRLGSGQTECTLILLDAEWHCVKHGMEMEWSGVEWN